MNDYLLASESVAEGHPDKMADQISDAILDAIFLQDPWGKVACECLMKTGVTIIAEEMSTHAAVDIEKIVRNAIKETGYNHSRLGFDGNTCYVLSVLGKQSTNIADDIRSHLMEEPGTDDQDVTFGYACDKTSELMSATLIYVHRLMERQAQLRKSQRLPLLLSDVKSQVTLRHQDNRVHSVGTTVAFTQHDPDVSLDALREVVIEEIVRPVMPPHWLTLQTCLLVNPAGSFMIDGPMGDCGLMGRKIIVDTYGGTTYRGGGAFSGKDSSKVDRSVAYTARYVVKNIVIAELASCCGVQLGWTTGLPRPVSVRINTFGTQAISSEALLRGVNSHFDLNVFGIITTFDLLVPRYCKTVCYGRFDRDSFLWGVTNKAVLLHEDARRQIDDVQHS